MSSASDIEAQFNTMLSLCENGAISRRALVEWIKKHIDPGFADALEAWHDMTGEYISPPQNMKFEVDLLPEQVKIYEVFKRNGLAG